MQALAKKGHASTNPNKKRVEERADINGDNKVDKSDLRKMVISVIFGCNRFFRALKFNTCSTNGAGDIDADGKVDFYDVYRLHAFIQGRLPLDVRYPIQRLFFDTNGFNFQDNLQEIPFSEKPTLTSSSASYRVRYERKGHVRRYCRHPHLNVSFDKNGALFHGLSSEESKGLGYQKLRFVSDCDLFRTYRNSFDFAYIPDVLMREYLTSQVLRRNGIASLDVAAFAYITFNAPPSYVEKDAVGGVLGSYAPLEEYPYLLFQRNDEKDDEVPFSKQFNISGDILESTTVYELLNEMFWDNIGSDYDLMGPYYYNYAGKKHSYSLDPYTTIKFRLLADFLDLSDEGPFHNEDYGEILDATGKRTNIWKIIPYGMDMSLIGMHKLEGEKPEMFSSITPETHAWLKSNGYFNLYREIAREFFGNVGNLYEILLIIDRYPFPSDRNNLKEFMRRTFYIYYKYYKK